MNDKEDKEDLKDSDIYRAAFKYYVENHIFDEEEKCALQKGYQDSCAFKAGYNQAIADISKYMANKVK